MVVAAIATALMPLASQTPPAQKPQFEVASIKPIKFTTGVSARGVSASCRGIDSVSRPNLISTPLGRCVITAARLDHVIGIAYDLPMNQIDFPAGRPNWLIDRFDIDGKAESPSTTSESQLIVMLQELLKDRFKLSFHRRTEQVSGYALVVAQGGSKLQQARSGGEQIVTINGGFGTTDQDVKANLVAGTNAFTITGHNSSMELLAKHLSIPTREAVVDKSGLEGIYDFKLMWDESLGLSLVTALREQLGLRLLRQKVPIEILVIDHIERPSEN
jgi:uncharacterized protein (TIGR03435 family)